MDGCSIYIHDRRHPTYGARQIACTVWRYQPSRNFFRSCRRGLFGHTLRIAVSLFSVFDNYGVQLPSFSLVHCQKEPPIRNNSSYVILESICPCLEVKLSCFGYSGFCPHLCTSTSDRSGDYCSTLWQRNHWARYSSSRANSQYILIC